MNRIHVRESANLGYIRTEQRLGDLQHGLPT
jgi:hypothetical protein